MSRVLLLGESWFVYSVHQKGFDAFYTSEYTEGGVEFVDVLGGAGHEVTRIPAHRIDMELPRTAQEIAEIADIVVISDVGANSFLLGADTFVRSRPVPDRVMALREFALGGGGVLMVGGYLSFAGIDGKARWGRSALADILPVMILDRDDRIEVPSGIHPAVAHNHPVVDGLDESWPLLLGFNEVTAGPHATVLATVAEHPLLVLGSAGNGRTAAFTSDLAPHWATPAFMEWAGYSVLFDRLVRWLAKEEI